MKKIVFIFVVLLQVACFGAKQKLTSVHTIDRHGISETVNSKDRLSQFDKTDFLSPQPYEKVSRLYSRDRYGRIPSIITSYHENGSCEQYLEAINQRACGKYRQWYSNGRLKLECIVMGGVADLTEQAKSSWLFEGLAHAFNEDGYLEAEFYYHKGMLCNEATYYHPNGSLWKIIPYEKDLVHGTQKIYKADGSLLESSEYLSGQKHGETLRFWNKETLASKEFYQEGKLISGKYFLPNETEVASVDNGFGFRAVFGEKSLAKLEEYRLGKQEGKVTLFYENGTIYREYTIIGGEKQGLDTLFYENGTPKIAMTWNQGSLNGSVKTWYLNGSLESQKEWMNNQKTGLSIVWYPEGSLMLVEEYDNDLLMRGEYYSKGEGIPLTKVEKGFGTATLFSENGVLLQKILYKQGNPEL